MLKARNFYLHEANEYVGPFCRRQDAEMFVALMEWSGESSEGIEIVELEADESDEDLQLPRRRKANDSNRSGKRACCGP